MSKRSERKQAKRIEMDHRRYAEEALKAAGTVGSIAELANPDDTGEMRTVLSTLLETEEALTNMAARYIRQR